MQGQMEWTAEQAVSLFCQAAVQSGLIEQEDVDYSINLLLDLLKLSAPQEAASLLPIHDLANYLVDYAISIGLCDKGNEARDRFKTKLFGRVTPGPAAIREKFNRINLKSGAKAATDWLYHLCCANDYIKIRRINRNIRHQAVLPQGELELLFDLAKPEKDENDLVAARLTPQQSYPKCVLCRENPGYAGRPGFPARQNHRIIPMQLHHETWYFQFSPYQYYPQQYLVINSNHQIMSLSLSDFQRMFEVIDTYPHYFIGSNADLPIVGGSILTHEHFQGGSYDFPLKKAKTWFTIDTKDDEVKGEALRWPMTCMKFKSASKDKLLNIMIRILDSWSSYSDPELGIVARSQERHNSLTSIITKDGDSYSVYLLLRNNRCTPEHPHGIFHPHEEYQHIKKENIGLIEAMGLIILQGNLRKELDQVEDFLLNESPLPPESPHRLWVKELLEALPETPLDESGMKEFVLEQLGIVCYKLMCDTGVYKQDQSGEEGLKKYLDTVFQ